MQTTLTDCGLSMAVSLYDSGIRELVDNFLLEESKKIRDYGDYWSASSAGYCMRKNILERLKVPHVETEADARKQRVFTAGHIFHEWMQDLTKKAGLSIAQEVELIDDDIMVKGHFDDLVLIEKELPDMPYGDDGKGKGGKFDPTIPEQHLILYDYKTVNSQSFKYKKDKMSHYHKMQLGTYLYMIRQLPNNLEKLGGDLLPLGEQLKNLVEGRILNISKDDLRMSEMALIYNEGLEKEVLDYWTTINKHWADKTFPACTCADHENGFMAREAYNPYFYKGEPCSLTYYEEWKNEQAKV